MSGGGPPLSVTISMMVAGLVVLAAVLVLPAYALALLLRRFIGTRARAAGWLVVLAALAGSAFWIVASRVSTTTQIMAYGEEVAFVHLASALAMIAVMLWPRGPLRR